MIKRIFQFKRMLWLLLFPLGLALIGLAKMSPQWVERLYAQKIHLFFERTVGRLVSWLPFSVTELWIAAAVILALFYIGQTVYRTVRQRKKWKHIWYGFLINALCAGSIAYFLFVITMGLNYYRASVTEYLGLQTKSYTVQELEEVCSFLAKRATETRETLPEDENGVAQLLSQDWWQVSAEAQNCFNEMASDFPGIGTLSVRNKPMVFSKLMSKTLTMGLYFPYTFESNINVDMTAYTVPSTMCHELSHVKGFMREDEANFLGFLACTYSEQKDFQYSGYMMAFGYALNQLAAEDRDAAVRVVQTVSEGVVRDDTADAQYWEQYRNTVISDTTGKVYDAYLQSNNQKDGAKSYGRMVDLVIAWYQQYERTSR